MLYALHESLRLVLDEGLESRWERHAANSRAFVAGLGAMGLELVVPEAERLAPLIAVCIPDGVDDLALRSYLLEHFGIEIGGGLGEMKGRAWRVGLMGAGSTRRNVTICLSALQSALRAQGRSTGDPRAAAADAAFR